MSFKGIVAGVLLVVLAGSIGARALMGDRDDEPKPAAARSSSSPTVPGGTSLVPEAPPSSPAVPQPAAETDGEWKDTVADGLPIVTEASFFALVGFALGYLSRKIVKIGLILLALVFVGLQALSYFEIITIDWDRALELVNRLVMNVRGNRSYWEMLKAHVPSAGGMVAGYALGFRKG